MQALSQLSYSPTEGLPRRVYNRLRGPVKPGQATRAGNVGAGAASISFSSTRYFSILSTTRASPVFACATMRT